MIDRIWSSQLQALEQLRTISEDLYVDAIKVRVVPHVVVGLIPYIILS